MTTVLGIDPGTVRCGWGLVRRDGRTIERLDSGVLRLKGPLHGRLGAIALHLRRLVARVEPNAVAVEAQWVPRQRKGDDRFPQKVSSALVVAQARGAATSAIPAAIAVREVQPSTLKLAVAGHGRASKDQVRDAVRALLRMDRRPSEDEADALAVALWCVMGGDRQLRFAR